MSTRRKWVLLGIVVPLVGWIAYANWPRTPPKYSELMLDTPASIDNSTVLSNDESEQAVEVKTKPDEVRRPFSVSLVYASSYLIDVGGLEKMHPFDIRKYQKIQDALVEQTDCQVDDFLSPRPLSNDDLLLVHTPEYIESLKSRTKVAGYLEAPILMLAPVSLETAIIRPFRHASGGTLLAARTALHSGIGINLGGGYHHAKPDKGEGFCIIADVPIAIRWLQKEGLIKRALVIDVDVHQGNGTIACLANDDTTFTFSMHQSNIYPIPKEEGDLDVELHSGMNDDQYLKVLKQNLPVVFDQAQADICFVVGGCDTLLGDPLASLRMTHEGIVQRDQMIIDACIDRKTPVVFTLSGGYSQDAWQAQFKSIANLIEQRKLFTPGQP